jgi:pyruvate dehydrogenase E2 component (dihydrolipoamide acetyltransferase)
MPMLGLTMTEGSITRWIKQEGDLVRKGEALFEVETDKALAEVEAPEDGILLRVLTKQHCTAQVGATVAILGSAGEELAAFVPETPQTSAHGAQQGLGVPPGSSQSAGAKRISPRARRLAEEHNVDWRSLKGSGAEGQITERDVQLRIAEADKADAVRPLSRIRQIIAERVTRSQQERAHIYLTTTIDMTEITSLRARLTERTPPQDMEAEVSFNDFFLMALGICLVEHPLMNSSLTSEGVRLHASANVGIAVALEDEGLVVPIIRDVQRLTLRHIAKVRQALVKKARERQLLPDDMTGGTFTLSNLGMYGVEHFTAIINPPETGILAVGSITDEPRVLEGRIVIRPVMRVTLGVDHRVVDGVLAGRFLQRFKGLLEESSQLVRGEE